MISSLELATLCGVSQGTVDRALHDRPGISAKTRARILAMAEQHGYVPNPAARELMGLSSSTMIGVVIPSRQTLRAPFFMDVLAELGQSLQDAGMQLSLWVGGPGPDGYRQAVYDTAARRPRALVLILPPENLVLHPDLIAQQPVFSLILPSTLPGVVSLIPDEVEVGRLATRHLLDLGHRRIVHLMQAKTHHSVDNARASGYRTEMEAAGCEVMLWAERADAPDLLDRLSAAQVTGVFCHHDPQALILSQRLRAAGIQVPERMSVIGVDRSPIQVAWEGSLTGVVYPYAAIARQVADLVLGREPTPIPPLEIGLGNSTGRAAK